MTLNKLLSHPSAKCLSSLSLFLLGHLACNRCSINGSYDIYYCFIYKVWLTKDTVKIPKWPWVIILMRKDFSDCLIALPCLELRILEVTPCFLTPPDAGIEVEVCSAGLPCTVLVYLLPRNFLSNLRTWHVIIHTGKLSSH